LVYVSLTVPALIEREVRKEDEGERGRNRFLCIPKRENAEGRRPGASWRSFPTCRDISSSRRDRSSRSSSPSSSPFRNGPCLVSVFLRKDMAIPALPKGSSEAEGDIDVPTGRK